MPPATNGPCSRAMILLSSQKQERKKEKPSVGNNGVSIYSVRRCRIFEFGPVPTEHAAFRRTCKFRSCLTYYTSSESSSKMFCQGSGQHDNTLHTQIMTVKSTNKHVTFPNQHHPVVGTSIIPATQTNHIKCHPVSSKHHERICNL